MPDSTLLEYVVERLAAGPPADSSVETLILAAFEGIESVRAELAGVRAETPAAAAPGASVRSGAFLASIEVEGFRGIGEPARLDIAPGPGLTLVVGRNGSGKSSFAEGLEVLLTGDSHRWSTRSKVWKEGWRNLHHETAALAATFVLAGVKGDLTIARRWGDGAPLDAGIATVSGHKAGSIDELGWRTGLSAYPPLLSHNELGRVVEESPSALYDALASILGLGELTTAQAVLREARKNEDDLLKSAQGTAETLQSLANGVDDERARRVVAGLSARKWDLTAIGEAIGYGAPAVDEKGLLSALRALVSLEPPSREMAIALAAELRAAQAELDRVQKTDSGRARATAKLLEAALAFHRSHETTDCPVCGAKNGLTFEWARQTGEEVERLTTLAAQADHAHATASALERRVHLLLAAMPAALGPDADIAELDLTEIRARWAAFSTPPQSATLAGLAKHLETETAPLAAAVSGLRSRAVSELERREDRWRPVAQRVAAWLGDAARALESKGRSALLKAAEAWLKDAHDVIRDARFAPIAAEVQANWSELRRDSNVELGVLKLTGATTMRRLVLDVTVDGTQSAALSVMSQGELNCLALSLFLPRAAMDESPFRFLVIDDPVQAMDPAKVEGLARVLERVGRTRQVVVFTHDDRLPEMARRLDIAATVIEVTRRPGSVVDVRPILDPVQRYLDDAFALTHKELPAPAQRAIPGLCRMALEAACQRAVTRRMVRDGASHDSIDAALAAPTTLNTWLALWLFGDVLRAGDVISGLQNRGWNREADAVRWCAKASHAASALGPKTHVRAVETLAGTIQGAP